MEKVSTEVVRRVWLDGEGVFVEIGPDADGLSFIELRTVGQKNEDWFGKIRFTMDPQFAAELGQALIRASNEAIEQYREDKKNRIG